MKLAKNPIGLVVLFLMLGLVAFAQEPASGDTSSAPSAVPSAPAAASSIPGSIMGPLSAGDLIDYSVYGVPEMTQRARLDSAGNAYLPLLGSVPLAGLTAEQAQKKLEDLLVSGGFLRNPHVTISVAEYANGISLLGEVAKPGVYPVAGPRRLYDVLAAAGGLTQNAGNKVTITPKDTTKSAAIVTISRDPSKSSEGNILVNPGDTVIVAKAEIVYVVGEVVTPSGFMLDGSEPLTVLQVIAMAHGANHDAKLDKTRIIRKTDKGRTEIPVQLSKIMSAKEKDIPLQADDIVFVPSSAAKSAARRTMDTAIQLATGVTLIRATR
ncbi:MAG TPA: polysaccharide biosynthesis/export family protein [Terriglobales bacterium]|nr:polysaccharide biosynthesis/export family protein [Terriglobales bacterium]